MTSPQTGTPDFLSGNNGPALSLVNQSFNASGQQQLGPFDVRAYRSVLISASTNTSVLGLIRLTWYDDATLFVPLYSQVIPMAFAIGHNSSVPCQGSYVEITLGALDNVSAYSVNLTAVACGGEPSSAQIAVVPFVWQTATGAASAGGGTATAVCQSAVDGLLSVQFDTAATSWLADLGQLQFDGSYHRIALVRSGGTSPNTRQLWIPCAGMQLTFTNNDAAPHAMNIFGSVGG